MSRFLLATLLFLFPCRVRFGDLEIHLYSETQINACFLSLFGVKNKTNNFILMFLGVFIFFLKIKYYLLEIYRHFPLVLVMF